MTRSLLRSCPLPVLRQRGAGVGRGTGGPLNLHLAASGEHGSDSLRAMLQQGTPAQQLLFKVLRVKKILPLRKGGASAQRGQGKDSDCSLNCSRTQCRVQGFLCHPPITQKRWTSRISGS